MGGVGYRTSTTNACAYSYLRACNANGVTMIPNAATEKLWLESSP